MNNNEWNLLIEGWNKFLNESFDSSDDRDESFTKNNLKDLNLKSLSDDVKDHDDNFLENVTSKFGLKRGDIIRYSGAIPQHEQYYNRENQEKIYIVLGFSRELVHSQFSSNEDDFQDITYISDEDGKIYYIIMNDDKEIDIL